MSYTDDQLLSISGIQHFVFCRRQWALIHIDCLWDENIRTVQGELMHENCHDAEFTETRRDTIITRAMPVFSATLGISGECDVVEFRRAKDGITLNGREGKYTVCPIEYKRGIPKEGNEDVYQLTAQVMCLEEMLVCEIEDAALYYGQTRKRLRVEVSREMKAEVRRMVIEMHELAERGYVPKVKPKNKCRECSLKNLCMPKLLDKKNVESYVRKQIDEG